jgi:hypothetical protein
MKVLTIGGAMIDTIAIIDSGRVERMSMKNADSSFLLLEEGWPAPGSADTELGVLMEPEVCHGATEVYARVQA